MRIKDTKVVVTHAGRFHADEVFAIATLKLLMSECSIIRTRDETLLQDNHIKVDIGGKYDPDTLCFDHHQTNGAGVRKNDIPYASFGLVWKKFGKELCGSAALREYIDYKIVQLIDAEDYGLDVFTSSFNIFPYTLSDIINSFIPKTTEEFDNKFYEALDFAIHCLRYEIDIAKELCETALPVIHKTIKEAEDPKILIFDQFDHSWRHLIAQEAKEAIFIIYLEEDPEEIWRIKSLPQIGYKYKVRARLPLSWAGKPAEELRRLTHVNDVVFCHPKGFTAGAKNRDGILELARIAIREDSSPLNLNTRN